MDKINDQTNIKSFKIPRKSLDSFKVGGFYKIKFPTNPGTVNISYYALEFNKINEEIKFDMELNQQLKHIEHLINTSAAAYQISENTKTYSFKNLNSSFICLHNSVDVLRSVPGLVGVEKVIISAYRQVPLFMFHFKNSDKYFIGSLQVDFISSPGLEKIFSKTEMTDDGVYFFENFFEEVNLV